jgi:predicted TIM-barrel fold metal-dependent hydrolase
VGRFDIVCLFGGEITMAKNGFKLIDAEMHVMESIDLWQRYIDREFAAAARWAYNDWLHDYIQAADPKRMFGAAAVSPHDVESAVTETRRAVRQLGMKAIFIRPNIHNERPWHDRYYDPLWATCQELNVPVGFHETTGSRMKVDNTAPRHRDNSE